MTDHNTSSDLDNQAAFSDCAYGDRDKLAKRFTQYLDHRNTTKGAYVANLNGAWGTGKTFFVDNWCHQLKENNRLAIKIDAWESDYLKDPLAIIVAELLEQVNEQSPLPDLTVMEKPIITNGLKLIKSFAPVLMMALGKKVFGDGYEDILKEFGTGIQNTSLAKNSDDFENSAFAIHKQHKGFAKGFKDSFESLLFEVNKAKRGKDLTDKQCHEKSFKTYIFLDELDRCRPIYAIEMLETVKHLFNIPNLVFVLSTDTAQLEHSIKAVYGEGFDAREYLSRFFEQRLLLPAPDHFTFLKSRSNFENLDLNENNQHLFPAIDSKDKVSAVLAMFCELNQISLRRTLQFADKLEAILIEFIHDKSNEMATLNLFELAACLLTREIYPVHAQKQSWNVVYLDNKWTKENSIEIKEELRPIFPFKPYQDLIKTIIDWSEEVLSNSHKQYRESIYKSKFGTSLSDSENQLIQIINSSTFRNFTTSHKWADWSSEINSNENIRHFLIKEKIDELVTLTSSQIGFVNDTESNTVPIFGARKR
ncbi:MAG: KAP family P-loop NTPase fold protein [Marinomonas sp.]